MAQNLAQLTDQWMVNPTMFDPTQASNQFSNYNNAALPWPPTYNTGLAGGPVNAATGKPIQSFQQWQQQNPGGMSINSTPAQPATPQAAAPIHGVGGLQPGQWDGANGLPAGQPYNNPVRMASSAYMPQQLAGNGGTIPYMPQAAPLAAQAAPQAGAQQAGAGGAPNNWQAAINSLANPGNPTTMGANVPMVTGSQPAGGVNAAFLQQAQGQPGMNPRFMSALAAIQGRPQQ